MKDEASYVCDSCGEEIIVPIDLSAGTSQEYVEECPVCCRPNVIHVEVDEDGDVRVGDDLKAVRSAMQNLARGYRPQELAHNAYRLYERFRPAIPEGVKGWGTKGDLDLGLIARLAKEK